MADIAMSTKGKGKRVADDEARAGKSDCNAASTLASHKMAPVSRLAAPKILRRHIHRRENIATQVWGPCVPGSDAAQPFSVYKAILRHPNLFFQFAIRLPQKAIIDLYAIDKEFHYRFNKYSTSIIHDFARYHAPQAAYIFSWVLFPDLCISDPMLRPMDGRPHLARDIPSLRWTQMVMYRDNVVHSILDVLAVCGHRVPREMCTVLMKFWLLMEMDNTAIRATFLADSTVWTDEDLYLFHLFLVKLDMLFSNPVHGHGFMDLSHILLTQKTLTKLNNVLVGEQVMDYDDLTDLLIRTYHDDHLDLDANPWLANPEEHGVIADEMGTVSREGWVFEGESMHSPVDRVRIEAINRGLHVQEHLVDFMMYGYVNPNTKQNIPAPRRWRGEKKMTVPKEPWPVPTANATLIGTLDEVDDIKQEESIWKGLVRGDEPEEDEAVFGWAATPEQVAEIENNLLEDFGQEMEVDG